jgi:hypothetical protein
LEELLLYNFKIVYQKGSENSKANTLSQQTDYPGYKVEKEKAIFKQKEDSLVYNYKLATISIIENQL